MAPKLAALPRQKELENLPAKELKELCKKRELGQGGSKDELVKRLVDYQKSIDKKDPGKGSQKSLPKAPAAKTDKDSSALASKTEVKVPAAKPVSPLVVPVPAQSSVLAAPSQAKASQPSAAVVEKPAAKPVVLGAASPAKPGTPPLVSLGITRATPAASPVMPSITPQVSSGSAASDKIPAPIAASSTRVLNQPHGRCIVIGGSVEFKGLKGQANLNGQRAEVLEWLKQTGRWRCRVANSGDVMNSRPRNLLPVGEAKPCPSRTNGEPDFVGQCVVVRKLESRPELVGELAEVLELLEEKGRWRCQLMRGDEQLNFKPESIVLSEPSVEPEAKQPRIGQ